MMVDDLVQTDRLELRVMSERELQALIDGDARAMAELLDTDPTFAITAPPEMDDALPYILDEVQEHPEDARWWAWLMIRRQDRQVVGSVGFGGKPNEEGTLIVGYSVYPALEGSGYASEATRALVDWALAQPGVERVQATIPPWHHGSLRVAEKAGFQRVGQDEDPEVGTVDIWERART